MDQVTQQNAAIVRQSTAAAHALARETEELSRLISRFTIGDEGPFDVIFCRNVMIYFTQDIQSKLWARMIALQPADSVLYIGHSERITGPATGQLVLMA